LSPRGVAVPEKVLIWELGITAWTLSAASRSKISVEAVRSETTVMSGRLVWVVSVTVT